MFCRKSNSLLIEAAHHYTNLGYQVGMTYGKELILDRFSRFIDEDWDGIAIILNKLVCVDMDRFISLGSQCILPPTLKERSPRGLHYFYRMPSSYRRRMSKVGWIEGVDLLTKDRDTTRYNATNNFNGHVLCSPSKGYSRLSPKTTPAMSALPMAPDWLVRTMRIDYSLV